MIRSVLEVDVLRKVGFGSTRDAEPLSQSDGGQYRLKRQVHL